MLKRRHNLLFRLMAVFVIGAFSLNLIILPAQSYAQSRSSANLPVPGTMIHPSEPFSPVLIKGVKVFSDNPFRFDFIVNPGDDDLEGDALKEESNRLIKYFLASLTIPEKDMWVNLSPYEADRIIPGKFGETEMGRDMLAQDYILKQLTASLMYPEGEIGEKFWERVYAEAYEKYGITDIPVDTFHKVWILPAKAVVYENAENNTAFVMESRLKVMLEEDYLAMANNMNRRGLIHQTQDKGMINHAPTTTILREIILPEIEREVNEGKHFAPLRQIYHSLILATWFKRNLQESLLGQGYVGKNKVEGVNIEDKNAKEKIYQQYVDAFKKGVYDLIREEYDPNTQEIVPRKYFSGGIVTNLNVGEVYESQKENFDVAMMNDSKKLIQVITNFIKLNEEDLIYKNFPLETGLNFGKISKLISEKAHQTFLDNHKNEFESMGFTNLRLRDDIDKMKGKSGAYFFRAKDKEKKEVMIRIGNGIFPIIHLFKGKKSHPNIMQVYKNGELKDGQGFIVLEFIEGENLSDFIQRKDHITGEEIKRVFYQLLSALEYFILNDIIFSDFKPDNIRISKDKKQVTVIDFHSAKSMYDKEFQKDIQLEQPLVFMSRVIFKLTQQSVKNNSELIEIRKVINSIHEYSQYLEEKNKFGNIEEKKDVFLGRINMFKEYVSDQASLVNNDPLGGIDFNPQDLAIETQGDGVRMGLGLNSVPCEEEGADSSKPCQRWDPQVLERSTGLSPVILNVVPLDDLSAFLN